MALKECKECGSIISKKAEMCPHCGALMKKKTGCLAWLILGILGVIFIGMFLGRQQNQSIKKSQPTSRSIATPISKPTPIPIKTEKKQRDDFIRTIEHHYQNLIELYEAENYEEVAKTLDLFIKYNRLDYKDVKEITIDTLEKKVKKIPASQVSENLEIYKKLLELESTNPKYKRKVAHYQTKYEEKKQEEERQRLKASFDLELLSRRWTSEHGYAIVEGQVKNISERKLERVEALVTWYDKDGNMITSDSSLIEYTPILSGQISPFKVMARYNPAMHGASIEFKFMWGNKIPTYYQKK